MAGFTYVTTLDIAVGALMLFAVLLVWRRELAALVRLLALQGFALALIPISLGAHRGDGTLLAVGAGVLMLRAALLPTIVARVLRGEAHPRETRPLLNTSASLLAVAALAVFSYAVGRPLTRLDPSPATHAAPLAIAAALTGIFMLVTRRRALAHVIGFVMLDNGIAATAFLVTSGVPVIVELGVSLDVLLAVLVLQILSGRMRVKFGGTDLDELRELQG